MSGSGSVAGGGGGKGGAKAVGAATTPVVEPVDHFYYYPKLDANVGQGGDREAGQGKGTEQGRVGQGNRARWWAPGKG